MIEGLSDLSIVWAGAVSFLTALILTPILRDIFRAYNVVDRPGIRKVHGYPIPRLGGIAIAAGYLLGVLRLDDGSVAWRILPGAAVILLIGILDDFFDLPPGLKFLGQIVAAGFAFWVGLRLPGPLWVSLPVTLMWLLLTMNSFNLVDGLDGLCSGLGFISAAALFTLGRAYSGMELQVATLPLMGALLGFLCFNASRATMFLGDSGALLIGFLTGSYVLLWSATLPATSFDGSMVDRLMRGAPILMLFVPLLESVLSISRRWLAGKPISAADRGHIHHRLLDLGLAPHRATMTLHLSAVICAGFGYVLALRPPTPWPWIILAIFCLLVVWGIQQLRYPEFEMASLLRGRLRRGSDDARPDAH